MRPSWIGGVRVVLKSNDWCPQKRQKRRGTDTEGKPREDRVTLPQAKGRLGPPAAGRGRKDPPPDTFTWDFWLLDLCSNTFLLSGAASVRPFVPEAPGCESPSSLLPSR